MKKIKYISLFAIIATTCFVGLFSSCKDEVVDLTLPRLFRPINFNVELNKTVATISWAAVDSAVSYRLLLSNDSLDFSKPLVDTTLTGLSFVKELAGETNFYARLYANAGDTAKISKFNTIKFRTPAENLFLGFGTSINTGKLYSAYMTDIKTLTVKWTPAANVTHLILSSADGATRDSIIILPEEALSGVKVISSLANSNYYIKIFNNNIQRGKTYGLVEGDIIVNSGGDLLTALNNATSGQVIILAGAAAYPIGGSAYNFSKNVKIRCASPTSRAVVCMTAGTPTTTSNLFGVVAASALDSIVFENIDFTGYCSNSNANTKIAYLFSNKVACTVGNLKFTNCNIHNFGNTTFRISGATNQVFSNLVFNGCIINEIGFTSTYALVNTNSADLVNNISFTNSTIYNFKGSLVLRTGSTINSINVSNCTINQATQDAGASRYMFDLNTTLFATGVTLKNCIFGTSGGALGANGMRYVANTPIAITGSFYTTDYLDDPIPVGATSTSFKSKMTPYSGASTALWNAPTTGDFTLKDLSFLGKGLAGDLRWY